MYTQAELLALISRYPDVIKVDTADIYWSEEHGTFILVVPQECKDYFFGATE